jgi:class 3 adenylate cyclase
MKCGTPVRRVPHLGDGSLVYFGYPVAREDAAARAVRWARFEERRR